MCIRDRDDTAGRFLLGPGVGAEHVAQLGHAGRGLQVVAHDVPDGQGGGTVGQGEGVVPVAADLGGVRGGQVADGHLESGDPRHLRQQVVLHGLGDRALALVEAGVVQRHPRAAGDVLQQGEIGGGEVPRLLGPAQGEGSQDLPGAADGGDGRGVDAGGLEQTALLDGDAGIRGALVGGGPGQGRGHPAQGPGQRHRRLLGHRRHRPFQVLVVHQAVAFGVHHGGAPHLVVLGDQVDDGPVRQPGQHQGHQPAQRLVDVEGGGQPGGGLGEQGQPLEVGQRLGGLLRAGLDGGLLRGGVEDDQRAGPPVAGVAEVVRGDQPGDGQQGTVAAQEVLLVALRRVPGVERLPHGALRRRQRLALGPAVQQVVGVVAEQVRGGPAQQVFGAGVGGEDVALLVDDVHPGADGLQRVREPGAGTGFRPLPLPVGTGSFRPCHVVASCARGSPRVYVAWCRRRLLFRMPRRGPEPS